MPDITQLAIAWYLGKQMDEIDRLNEQWEEFRLLKSVEVDILERWLPGSAR